MQEAASDNPRLPLRPVLVWATLVATISGLGLVPFYAFVPDLSKFTGNLPPAELALLGIGVELAAVGPSLAAILVAWRMPGAGGARGLFRQSRHAGWVDGQSAEELPLLGHDRVTVLVLSMRS